MPITAALILPFRATSAHKARLRTTELTIAAVESPPASSGVNPMMYPPPMIAAKITASTELRPSSDQ